MQVKRKVRSAATAAVAGYRAGYGDGRRDGACEALAGLIPPPEPQRRAVRMMYVPQGFEAIDRGIAEALRPVVRELHVVDAANMAEQAAQLRPDWLLVLNGLHTFPGNHLEQIGAVRELGVRTAIWFADDPYYSGETVSIAPHYDTVLTHELGMVDTYARLGCPDVHYLPLAVHSAQFRPMRIDNRYRSDICFVGQAFWNRVETFDAIAPYLAQRRVFIAGVMWERLRHYGRLSSAIRHGWLPIEEAIRYYNGAKIVINLHRTTAAGADNRNTLALPGLSINPRTFEIAACGTLQLTDLREDLPRHYAPGSELETFADPGELRAKLDYYLNHEEERRAIALRGLRRTLRHHTFASRVQQLAEVLKWPYEQ